ncbi:MAG: quinone-dependent dihydroorotate dehydrogenase [Candidatus Peregrinibacteria bacterium]|nr:quinone-dependent dihydroorotate dehydrogenase [Candidatus Peregrinibacteria bacterium]MDZ4244786.1 quinone-dependent dihydroorotate dehydrogenase [Candidatus Gracilibacteria bacterium]
MRRFFSFFYRHVCKPILFKFDPEKVHDHFMWLGSKLGRFKLAKDFFEQNFVYRGESLEQEVCSVRFANPVGIAGGFDKNARLTQIIPSLGFGFHEIGSITAKPYDGNPKPRLKRFPKTRSLWVNYGLKNKGASVIHDDLKNILSSGGEFKIPLFVNVAKTNCKETAEVKIAVEDYCESVKIFSDMASAFTINISCPNAFGGQPFHKPEDLEALLFGLDKLQPLSQLIFLKISPELTNLEIDSLLAVCDKHKVDGIIISNLRKKKVDEDFDPSERFLVAEHGGLSGKYLEPLADNMLKYIATKVKHKDCNPYVLIGLGGIFTAEDAYRKIRLGATLVQLITGMIFEGPQVIGEINEGLAKLLIRDGFSNISEAIGADIN